MKHRLSPNAIFNASYSDGGVNLRILPGSMDDAFPSFKIAPTPYGGGITNTNSGMIPTLHLDTELHSFFDFSDYSGFDFAAFGGFLIYPNKLNTDLALISRTPG